VGAEQVAACPRGNSLLQGATAGQYKAMEVGPEALVGGRVQVWTDGSVVGSRCGVGVVILDREARERATISAGVRGWVSSTKAEITAALLGISLVQGWLDIEVMTDSQGLVQGYQRHVEGQRGGVLGWRRQLQTRYYQEWAALRHVCSRREGQVTITKVPAHRGIHGNEVADRLAKGGALSASPELAPVLMGEEIPWVPQHKGLVIEGHLRRYLRMQSLFRHGARWSRLGHFAARQLQLFEVDWWATFESLHSGVWPGSLVTSGAASRARAYRIKLLHGSLPTAVRMKTLYPRLYADDVCRRCGVVVEDSTHIWCCTVAARVLQQLRAVAAQALGVEELALPAPGHGWEDILSGLVPVRWVEGFVRRGSSKREARRLAARVSGNLVQAGYREVWVPRCAEVADWERGMGISSADKRTYRRRITANAGRAERAVLSEGRRVGRPANNTAKRRVVQLGGSDGVVQVVGVDSLGDDLLRDSVRGVVLDRVLYGVGGRGKT